MAGTFLFLLTVFATTISAQDGFTSLFNGKDLTGWDGDPKLWKVEDGIVIGTCRGPEALANNSFLIWRGGKVSDFELRATIRVIGDNNSGIQYRSRELPHIAPWVITGYQCDIHPAIEHTGMTYEEKGRGIFGLNGSNVMLDPGGALWLLSEHDPVKVDVSQWNEYTVIARGNHLIHKINGEVTSELIDHDEKGRAVEGLLAIQLHGGNPNSVQVKNLRLKPLADGKLLTFDAAKLPAGAKKIERPGSNKPQGTGPVVPPAKKLAAEPAAAALPYPDDPAVIQAIANLADRSALTLPRFKVEAKSEIYGCQTNGPVTRGYTMRMAYASDRQTALYHGGDHQTIRSNDVWEYHLGSNTWHTIFEPDGGNHGPMKDVLLFLARRLREKPDQPMTNDERKRFEEVRPWWKANVILKDGHFTTTHGGPILPVHTWDTLVYEPNRRVMIHGTGASPTDSAVLQSHYTGVPLAEVDRVIDKSYSSIWMFDPFTKQWIIHKRPSSGAMPDMEGMGATMCYIPDLKRVLYYVAAQNVSPHAYGMWSWDVVTNEWTELKPNGGKSIDTLVLRDKVAPTEEQQTAYSPKHKQMVAVIGNSTFAYHIVKNEWSRLNDQIPLECHDAKTMFAYDSINDVFLLTDGNKEGRVAVFSLTTNKWELVTPSGDGCPPSDYGAGKYWAQPKGYFDPRLNVLVVHGGMTDRVWIYRHQQH